ncbi:hypothetical protein ACFX13_033569 [Malus domestica]
MTAHEVEAHIHLVSAGSPADVDRRLWSPDAYRDEAWHRRKKINGRSNLQRSKSVTDEDLDELKACIELGFRFDSPKSDKRLADTLPALGLYYAVNKKYCDSVSNKSTATTTTLTPSECDSVTSSQRDVHGESAEHLWETIAGKGQFKTLVTNLWSSLAGRGRLKSHIVHCQVLQV